LSSAVSRGAGANANNNWTKIDKIWKEKKGECEVTTCKQFKPIADEGMNCVNECVSTACYQKTYAELPLEDGEIDHKRSRDYLNCVRKEYKAVLLCSFNL
jgi:hypothetical protein